MNWYNYKIQSEDKFSLFSSNNEVWLNDINIKPDWIKEAAWFTEFHVKRNKENLLLVVGESWTYGESLAGIATGIGKYNFKTQLIYAFGSNMAMALDTDLYQYAVPGNCNFYMFKELDRILSYVKTLGYKKIYLCMQLTEPGREHAIINKLLDHPLKDLYIKPKPITFTDWLIKYDEIFFQEYDDLIKKYQIDEAIIWKNFCSTNTSLRNFSFKIIETSWIKYSASLFGIKLDMPMFYVVNWLATMQEEYSKIISFDEKMLMQQIDIIEASNNYLGNPRHRPHPDEVSHILWAQYLLLKSGWKND